MKVALATAFTLVLMQLSTSAIAQQLDCQMEIREGSAARDLGRVLRCFDERINAFEAKVGVAESRKGPTTQANAASEFDAGSFGVSIRAATRTQNREQITVLVNFRNKTTEEIYIGSSAGGDGGMHLFDEQTGDSSGGFSSAGLKTVFAGTPKDAFTIIPPSTTVSASLSFDGERLWDRPPISRSMGCSTQPPAISPSPCQ